MLHRETETEKARERARERESQRESERARESERESERISGGLFYYWQPLQIWGCHSMMFLNGLILVIVFVFVLLLSQLDITVGF